MNELNDIWAFLSTSSLFWLAATLGAYALAQRFYKFTNWNSFANPVAVAIIIVMVLLLVTGTSYKTYFDGAQFIHFLLGPTTVALAIPLYDLRQQLAKKWLPILLGLICGALTAIISSVLIAGMFGASMETIISLAPKSVTTPIAMSIADKLGGSPALAASFVVITGVLGGVICAPIFKILNLKGDAERGFALGLASHGVGTSRAFQFSQECGTYASLAIGLCGLMTAVIAPFMLPILLEVFK